MSHALIALGSNLGDREAIFAKAEARLARLPDTRTLARSRACETAPVGGPAGQDMFLNAAILLQTSLAPEALLDSLGRIETELGRRRAERWGPRSIDLDLLLYDELVLETPTLVLPHPRMAWRRFVLEPAAEIARSMAHPTIGWTIGQLLEHLNTATPYVAIAGLPLAGKTWLARELAREGRVRLLVEHAPCPTVGGDRDNSSGSDWPLELQSLKEWTRLLEAGLPQWSGDGPVWMSDFWFDQWIAVARALLPDDQTEAFHRRWQLARQAVVQPKLVVWLDPPTESLLVRLGQRVGSEDWRTRPERWERMRSEIGSEAMQRGRGPCLRVTSAHRPSILAEVSAALEAMK